MGGWGVVVATTTRTITMKSVSIYGMWNCGMRGFWNKNNNNDTNDNDNIKNNTNDNDNNINNSNNNNKIPHHFDIRFARTEPM